MKRHRLLGLLAVFAATGLLLATAGCGGDKKDATDAKVTTTGGGSRSGPITGGPAPGGKKEELASSGWGTLKGKAVLDGALPDVKKDIVFPDNKDKDYCHKGDASEQTWKVDANKGVANVVVWLQVPDKSKYFKISDADKKRDDVKEITQPFCAFEPHVSVLYPSYFDGQKQVETGQKFRVVNNAEIAHNTNWVSTDNTLIKGDNVQLPAKTGQRVIEVKVSKEKDSGKMQRIDIHCDIHKWMTGFALVFDHPFVAVTKADGTFEIKNVPTGAAVDIMYWHESLGKPQKLETATLKDGETKEIKVPAK